MWKWSYVCLKLQDKCEIQSHYITRNNTTIKLCLSVKDGVWKRYYGLVEIWTLTEAWLAERDRPGAQVRIVFVQKDPKCSACENPVGKRKSKICWIHDYPSSNLSAALPHQPSSFYWTCISARGSFDGVFLVPWLDSHKGGKEVGSLVDGYNAM
jgi:hypothetical protein